MAGEPGHVFFDRVEGPFWDEVRQVADDFLSHVPKQAHKDIVERWRSGDDAAGTSAWWEVYLHEWLIRSGFAVELHEVQSNGRAPDFKAERDGLTIYVEATGPGVARTQRARGNRQEDLYKQLNQVRNDKYFLWIKRLEVGTAPIRYKGWRAAAERWLNGLGDADPEAPAEPLVLTTAGWEVELVAMPRRAPADPGLGPRSIGIYPMEGGVRDDVAAAKRLVRSKRTAYGDLDGPLVVAAWCQGIFFRPDEWRAALLGSIDSSYTANGTIETVRREYDGLWGGPGAWKDTHVGGVLIGVDPSLHSITRSVPQWWAHPAGGLQDTQISALLEAYVDAPHAELAAPASVTPSEFFGLSDPWPAVEDPWSRRRDHGQHAE
jgi:hypothetical protein